MRSLVWFRNDLRIYDNPALNGACQSSDGVVAVFFECLSQWQGHGISESRLSLLYRQLDRLKQSLSEANIPLVILSADSFDDVPKLISELCEQLNITSLHFSQELPHDERKRDHQVATLLKEKGVAIRAYHDQCLMKPGTVLNKQGAYFKTFSSFKRTWFSEWKQQSFMLTPKPADRHPDNLNIDIAFEQLNLKDRLDAVSGQWARFWPAGEEEAHVRLNRFLEARIKEYKDKRDFPLGTSTSLLSPYMNLGIISPKQCLHGALSVNQGVADSGSLGVQTWVNELIWRDFYRHFVVGYPQVCKNHPFVDATRYINWREDEADFEAWKQGKTGYPLVDAAMRQLNKTGWMHNRLRMVSAMFLTKHLLIHWRKGEQYFMEQLVDGDFASNNGGWQWSASTGVDAVPYFRVFNPIRQAERFDPEARFIRKQIQELRQATTKDIHRNERVDHIGEGYPLPIVEHKFAVARVKEEFKLAQQIYQDQPEIAEAVS